MRGADEFIPQSGAKRREKRESYRFFYFILFYFFPYFLFLFFFFPPLGIAPHCACVMDCNGVKYHSLIGKF